MKYDYLVVGSGFAGAVVCERLASQLDKKVLLVEKRPHTGGNAYDYYDEAGILVHKYGAHIFHTNHDDVWQYVNQFSSWNGYVHRVLAYVDGLKLPIPINLTTVNTLLKKNFDEQGLRDYLAAVRVNIANIKDSRDVVLSQVGEFFYEKFFKNYTYKQWGVYPEELSPEVTRRIPLRFNTDDRYFGDKYEGLPVDGFYKLFDNMLDHKNITVALETDYKKIIGDVKFDYLIYTGPVDYFFDNMHGELPYRSQSFEFETLDVEYYQEAAVINYPNDNRFTKITESKHFTKQKHPRTTIVREFPEAVGEPYYPVPMASAAAIYEKYKKEADKLKTVYFAGRLAEYKYYNMDQAVKRALDLFSTIAAGKGQR
ncbi:MAG: UDP-galactopyranose mutase [Candidatus Magnetominusculus sp. LBB02]|nr:UDP-galactopyranose mutase [Candidatus Magnetominusculus sp. LBB02]